MTDYEGKDRYKDPNIADSYDDVRFTSLKGRLTDYREKSCITKALAGLEITGPILDLPCGTGRITELLLNRGHKVVAGDISESMMAHAEEKLKNYSGQVSFEVCDIEDLQFDDNAFCLITTIRLLHHIPPELHQKILSQLHRVTKKWVILTYSNKYSVQNIRRDIKSIFTKFPRYAISGKLFKREISEAGFKIIKYIHMFPFVSESIVVLLEKKE